MNRILLLQQLSEQQPNKEPFVSFISLFNCLNRSREEQ